MVVWNLTHLEQKRTEENVVTGSRWSFVSDDPRRLCERIIIGGKECAGCRRR